MKSFESYSQTDNIEKNNLSDATESLGKLQDSMIQEKFNSYTESSPALLNIETNDKIEEILEKIIGKCLESNNFIYGVDQDFLEGKNIQEYVDNLTSKNPELRGILNFELKIGEILCNKYENCKPSDKIKLLSLVSALEKNSILPNNHIKNDGKYNIEKVKQRYIKEIKNNNDRISGLFKLHQFSNFGLIEKTLREDYGLSEAEINEFKNYLEKTKNTFDSTKPIEGNMGYAIAFIAGVLATLLGVMVYDKLVNPTGMKEIDLKDIELTGLSLLGKIVSADAGFKQTGSSEEKMYNVSDDDNRFNKNAKKIANSLQTKKIIMEIEGKVGAEFDISEESGAKFIYSPKDKIMKITLNEPEFLIRESNPKVIYKNSEVFEMDRFNDSEINLLKDLENSALNDEKITSQLSILATKNIAKLLYNIYKPIIESPLIPEEYRILQGVEITINGKPYTFTDEQLKG